MRAVVLQQMDYEMALNYGEMILDPPTASSVSEAHVAQNATVRRLADHLPASGHFRAAGIRA